MMSHVSLPRIAVWQVNLLWPVLLQGDCMEKRLRAWGLATLVQ